MRLQPDYAEQRRHANQANFLLTQPGREAEVIAHCRRALELDAKRPMPYYVLALLEIRQGHETEVIHLCNPALQADPHYEDARRTSRSYRGPRENKHRGC